MSGCDTLDTKLPTPHWFLNNNSAPRLVSSSSEPAIAAVRRGSFLGAARVLVISSHLVGRTDDSIKGEMSLRTSTVRSTD